MSPDRDFPGSCSVVVSGAGPVGLTIANLLGTYGIDTLLVERNETTVQEPRAVSIDDESLRTMHAIGLIEIILPTIVPGYGSTYLTASRRPFLKVEPADRPFGYPKRNAFRQPALERQLRDGLDRFPCVATAFGWTMHDFVQDEHRVHLTLGRGDAQRTVTADYLIGADGGRSLVRQLLNIRMLGHSRPEKWLIVDLEHSPVTNPGTIVFCDVRRPAIALPGPDNTRRFEFKLLPGESAEAICTAESVASLLRAHGAAPSSIVRRKLVYTFHALVAESWSRGRVFLAGDAAHLTPPFAGQGMNSGIRDAHNLAWKIAAVVQGRLRPAALATYQEERQPHVSRMIDLALRMGRIMGPPGRLHARLVQSAFIFAGIWPPLRAYLGEMRFRPKPFFRSGMLVPGKSGMIGKLLPLPSDAEQGAAAFDDELGLGFVLIGVDVADSDLLRFARSGRWERIEPRCIALGRETGVHWGLKEPHILLVRPDRFVMACQPWRDRATVEEAVSLWLDDTAGCAVPDQHNSEVSDRLMGRSP